MPRSITVSGRDHRSDRGYLPMWPGLLKTHRHEVKLSSPTSIVMRNEVVVHNGKHKPLSSLNGEGQALFPHWIKGFLAN